MKLIHLSDLHLGKRANEFSMLEDQAYILNKILEIIDSEEPDGVILAGDVYDKSIPPVEAVELLDTFLVALSKRQQQVFLITGNHDSAERVAFGGRLMEERGIHIAPVYHGEVSPTVLTDEYGELAVYLLPFVKPVHVRRSFPEEEIVSYTDAVGMMMSMMQVMLNAITYVLVAFTAISLVVSSVMIGIITYVSVVERVKEIGVLRSLGARKKDIKNLFNADTFIIGFASGVIGVVVSYLIAFVVNLILEGLTGIPSLATLPFTSAMLMIAISVTLTLISGLIPANAAAKKDPVVALRTE